jgi:cysteine synthase
MCARFLEPSTTSWKSYAECSGLIHDDVLSVIGHSPLVRLHRVVPPGCAEVLAKLEFRGPGGSIKDRAALAMVLAAKRDGHLRPGATIVETSAGNSGIGLALVCAVRGYRCRSARGL